MKLRYKIKKDCAFGGPLLLHPVAKPRYKHFCSTPNCCNFVGHVGITDYWVNAGGLIARQKDSTHAEGKVIHWRELEGAAVSETEAEMLEFAFAMAGLEGWL